MLKSPPGRLLHALRSVGEGPCDADLLGRFAEYRDEAAFEELLHRHADMVLRVCRRHLGSGPDADDAFQAVFLVLARDAVRIGRREALAGWLYRVAYHVSRKLMGRNARRRTLPVRDADALSVEETPELDRLELRVVVEEEVNGLPDHLRSSVVLCYLEGRSNREAAALLGVPTGTVDSRLAAARKRLHGRLLGRGVTVGATAALESLGGEVAMASPALTRRVLESAMQFAHTGSAASAVSHEVLSIVTGVAPTMTTHRISLIAAAAVLLATLGGTGLTVFHAQADGQPPAKPTDKPRDKPKDSLAAKPPETPPQDATLWTNETVTAALKMPMADDGMVDNVPLGEFLQMLQDRYRIPMRIDLAAFARTGVPNAVEFYRKPISLPVLRGMSIGDAIRDALAQIDPNEISNGRPLTWRARAGQILIIPAFQLAHGSVGSGDPGGNGIAIPANHQLEQDEGEPVSLSVDEKTFLEVLRELRQTTGLNIVLDVREKKKAETAVTASLHDVRLMAALRVLGDMCDLQPVALNNVFYVTSKENAEKLQREIDQRRYGDQNLGGMGFGGGLPAGGGLGGPAGAAPMGAAGGGAPMPPPSPPASKPKDAPKPGSGME